MKEKTIQEIIDENRAQRIEAEIRNQELDHHEFALVFCYNQIKAWKQWYFKRNCKKHTQILARCTHRLLDGRFYYKHYLQLFRNGKRCEEYLIKAEAYDTLTRGMKIETFSGVDTTILAEFHGSE